MPVKYQTGWVSVLLDRIVNKFVLPSFSCWISKISFFMNPKKAWKVELEQTYSLQFGLSILWSVAQKSYLCFHLIGLGWVVGTLIDRGNDPWGLNRTFVLCCFYFCFCLELSPLVMNRHVTPNLYHLDAIWVYLLKEIWHLAPIKTKFDSSPKISFLALFLLKGWKIKRYFYCKFEYLSQNLQFLLCLLVQ